MAAPCRRSSTPVLTAALIFEDDAEIDADIADVIDVIDRLPPRARIVKLEGIQASYETNYPVARVGERNVMMMLKPSTGAAGYYINRAGAEQILPRLFPIREPFDAFLRQYWSHGVEVLETRPFPVRQRPLATMIPGRNEQRRARLPLPYAALRGVCMPALKLCAAAAPDALSGEGAVPRAGAVPAHALNVHAEAVCTPKNAGEEIG